MQTQLVNEPWWKHHTRWHWVILFVVLVLGIASIFIVNVNFSRDYARSQTTSVLLPKSKSVLIRVVIDFGDKRRAFEGEARRDMTLKSAISEIAGTYSMSLDIKRGLLTTLGTKKSKPGGPQWNVYLNDALKGPQILDLTLKGGDHVALRYE